MDDADITRIILIMSIDNYFLRDNQTIIADTIMPSPIPTVIPSITPSARSMNFSYELIICCEWHE